MAIDQKIRAEDSCAHFPLPLLHVIRRYRLVWQWLLNPTHGIQKLVRSMGFPRFCLDWIVAAGNVIYCL